MCNLKTKDKNIKKSKIITFEGLSYGTNLWIYLKMYLNSCQVTQNRQTFEKIVGVKIQNQSAVMLPRWRNKFWAQTKLVIVPFGSEIINQNLCGRSDKRPDSLTLSLNA